MFQIVNIRSLQEAAKARRDAEREDWMGRNRIETHLDDDIVDPLFLWSLLGCVALGLTIWGLIIMLLL